MIHIKCCCFYCSQYLLHKMGQIRRSDFTCVVWAQHKPPSWKLPVIGYRTWSWERKSQQFFICFIVKMIELNDLEFWLLQKIISQSHWSKSQLQQYRSSQCKQKHMDSLHILFTIPLQWLRYNNLLPPTCWKNYQTNAASSSYAQISTLKLTSPFNWGDWVRLISLTRKKFWCTYLTST